MRESKEQRLKEAYKRADKALQELFWYIKPKDAKKSRKLHK